MQWLRALGRRVRVFLWRERFDRDLEDEMHLHIQLRAEDMAARGAASGHARIEARRRFGNATLLLDQSRDAWSWRGLESLVQDVRYGARLLWRRPGFALVSVVTLALGIGANAAIFSVVYGLLLRPLPYPDADRVAILHMHFSPQNLDRGPFSVTDFLDVKARSHSFALLGAYTLNRFDLTGVGLAEQLPGASVTPEFFAIVQVKPLLGRVFQPSDDGPTAAPVVVISEPLWRRTFQGDPTVVGRAIRISGSLQTIVGVVPSAFRLPTSESEIWTNLRLAPPTRRGPFFLTGVARLAPGVTWAQTIADAREVARSIETANSRQYSRLSLVVLPLREALLGNTRLALVILLAAVGCVLLIATANVANLLMARGAARRREMAVRLCLGATRPRLVKQLLVETLLLVAVGGGTGCLLAFLAVHGIRGWSAPSYVPSLANIRLDLPVLAFTAAITLATGVAVGMLPAARQSRLSIAPALKKGERGNTRGGDDGLRSALVVAEVGLSVLLLTGAGLFLRSLVQLERVDLGIAVPVDQIFVVVLSIPPAAPGDAKDHARVQLFDQLLERVRRQPGVTAAALADARIPDYWTVSDTFQVEGEPWSAQAFPSTPLPSVSDGYFETLGIPLIRGRTFDQRDTPDSPIVAVISANLAHRYFPTVDPIGRYLRESSPGVPGARRVEIVGVAGDVPYGGLQRPPDPVFYEPLAQSTSNRVFLEVHSSVDPHTLAAAIRRELQGLNPDIATARAATLGEYVSDEVIPSRFLAQLTGGFALLALALASVGLYGVISYLVGERTQEIGLRLALGASPREVLVMVLRRGTTLAASGVIVGGTAALITTRVAARLLFGIAPTDPLTFASVVIILLVVAMVASYLPARRATRINPVVALRDE